MVFSTYVFLPPCYGAASLQGFALPCDSRDQNVQLVIMVALFDIDMSAKELAKSTERW